MEELIEEQKNICAQYDSNFVESPAHLKVGISLNVREGVMPLNGVRYEPEGDTSGWYIWAGEEFSEDPDFFVPLHIEHLNDWSPLVLKYLGLAPGTKFLLADDGYVDVWKD
jgi:hypothetical protein